MQTMSSEVKELYEVAVEYVSNLEDCSPAQIDKAFLVIELVEDGKLEDALKVGLIY